MSAAGKLASATQRRTLAKLVSRYAQTRAAIRRMGIVVYPAPRHGRARTDRQCRLQRQTVERRLRDWLQRAASTPWLRIRNRSCSCSRSMGIRPQGNRVRHGGNTSRPDCLDLRDGEMRHALRWQRQSRGRATDRPVRDYAKRIKYLFRSLNIPSHESPS